MIKRTLLIVIAAGIIGAAGLAALNKEEFRARLALERGGTFSLYNVTGMIDITAWNRDYVDVLAVKRTNRLASELKKVKIEIQEGRDATVKTVYLSKNASVGVDYELRVPAGARIKRVENVTGDVRLEGAARCDEVKTVTGSLFVRCTAGPCRAENVTGNIRVYLAGLSGDAFYKTTTGTIDLFLRPDLDAELEISVVTGGISNDGLKIYLGDITWTPGKRLRGVLGAGGHTIYVDTVTGNVNLSRFD